MMSVSLPSGYISAAVYNAIPVVPLVNPADGIPSTDVYSYVPTLLRIGGFIHEDDISVNKGIVFFFD